MGLELLGKGGIDPMQTYEMEGLKSCSNCSVDWLLLPEHWAPFKNLGHMGGLIGLYGVWETYAPFGLREFK